MFLFLLIDDNEIFVLIRYNGFESIIESEAYYLTNGHEICYLNSKDKSCTQLPTE